MVEREQAAQAFEALNRERLHHLLQLGSPRQQLIIELLPFLFHSNSRRLPGHVSDDTPAGIIDYHPDKDTLGRAKQVDAQFHYRHHALRRYPIRGLYLIHPHSSLSLPKQPELDLWLLHMPIEETQLQQLRDKLDAIVSWAAEGGLTFRPRLLSETDLEQGVLSAWERDQFYSAGLVLAGSHPYWWRTSPDEDNDYAHSISTLKQQRRQAAVNLIDFGVVEAFSSDDLFRLSLEALATSLLDAGQTLNLRYLSASLQQPASCLLSARYKRQVYGQQAEAAYYDVDFLKLQTLPAADQTEARELFYLQSQEVLSKTVRQAIYPWRRTFIAELSKQWGWDETYLSQLDQQAETQQAGEQYFAREGAACKTLLAQLQALTTSYESNSANTLKALQRLYRLRHQPNLDQIPSLPLQLRPNTDSDRLYLTRFADSTQWQLSRMPLSQPSQQALYSHENLLPVLGYAIANRLLSRSNWLSVNDQQQRMTTASVVELTEQLLKTGLADTDLHLAPQQLTEPEIIKQVSLFANLEQGTASLPQQSLQLSSKQNDPLNYSSFGQSLVLQLDGIIQSSYGLLYHFRFDGEQAPLELLRYLVAWPATADTQCQSWCATAVFGQAIQQRLKVLVKQTVQFFLASKASGRLLIDIAGSGYALQWRQGQAEYFARPAQQNIWPFMMSASENFVAQRLDLYLDRDGLVNTLLSHQASDRINVFIYLEQHTIMCYLLDEFGNLIRQQYQQMIESTLLGHLHLFLSEIRHRNQIPHLRFYRLQHSTQGWQTTPLAAPRQTQGYLPIRLSMSTLAEDANYQIHCGKHHFSGQRNDPALFRKVHELVQSVRKQQKFYPVYLNSLLIDDGQYHPASIYMREKNRLEMLFNSG
jgi:adenylate cyclase class 1